MGYGFAGFKKYFGDSIQSEWSAMVWECFEEDNDDVSGRALDFEAVGRRGRGRPKMTGRRQVVKQVEEIRPIKEDTIDRPGWRDAVHKFLRMR